MKNSIQDKGGNPCCSCGVCAIICPVSSIEIGMDESGFYRPKVNEDVCKQCGVCKEVCYKYLQSPENNQHFFKDKKIFGAWSKDEDVVKMSSSGGVGGELIVHGLSKGYLSCGVIFEPEKERCQHILAESKEVAQAFCGSKYLQSFTAGAFSQFQPDKKYIVVGTPCQIYGLRQYIKLKKWEDNFILVDFFCHGTPSYLLWQKYKEYLKTHHDVDALKEVWFRSKENGKWHENAVRVDDTTGNRYFEPEAFKKDLFFKFFHSNSCLNDSCPRCLLRHDICSSDIRVADFWGGKYKDNEKGVSLVALNTKKGEGFFAEIKERLVTENCTFADLQDSQRHRYYIVHKRASKVMHLLKTDMELLEIYKRTIKPTLRNRLKERVRKQLRKLFNNNK